MIPREYWHALKMELAEVETEPTPTDPTARETPQERRERIAAEYDAAIIAAQKAAKYKYDKERRANNRAKYNEYFREYRQRKKQAES